MRKTLLATTALAAAGAFAAGPTLAADMVSVGVGGFMEQWIGGASVDRTDKDGKDLGDGGVRQYSDSEVIFNGSLEADNGLKFSVKVELEGNSAAADQIDESQATVSGNFGQIQIGSEDHAASLMHYGNKDVGVGLNCGDASFIPGITSCAREGNLGLGTSGWLIGGDDQKVSYYTPRMEGVQFGVSYVPDTDSEDAVTAALNNDHDAVAVGLNYMGGIGDVSVALSAGHYVAGQTGTAMKVYDGGIAGAMATDPRTRSEYTATAFDTHKARLEALGKKATAGTIMSAEMAEVTDINARRALHQVSISKADERTFTNFGLQVGFGAFSFDAAYAMHDGGAYMKVRSDINPTAGLNPIEDDPTTTGEGQDESKANVVREVLVKDGSQDYETVSVGAMYSDGPMAISLSYMMSEDDAGGEANTAMLSGSYTLAPGVAWKTSVFAGEQNTAKSGSADGTAFVTGIKLSF